MASSVKELVSEDLVQKGKNEFLTLPLQDENLLLQLFHKLESNWQDPEFDIENYCQEMAMSK